MRFVCYANKSIAKIAKIAKIANIEMLRADPDVGDPKLQSRITRIAKLESQPTSREVRCPAPLKRWNVPQAL
jgi:hypothetical protein